MKVTVSLNEAIATLDSRHEKLVEDLNEALQEAFDRIEVLERKMQNETDIDILFN